METLADIVAEPDNVKQTLARLLKGGVPAGHISLLLTYGIDAFGLSEYTCNPIAALGARGGTWKGEEFAPLAGSPYFYTSLGPLFVLGPLVHAALDATGAGVSPTLLDTILEQRFSPNEARLCSAALSNGCAVIAAASAVRKAEMRDGAAIER